jgi:cAMP-dependent protein kinase regulator
MGAEVRSGWLRKRGPTREYRFEKRWCVLRATALEYYVDEDCLELKGRIHISEGARLLCPTPSDENARRFTFDIPYQRDVKGVHRIRKNHNQSFVFEAETICDFDVWLEAFGKSFQTGAPKVSANAALQTCAQTVRNTEVSFEERRAPKVRNSEAPVRKSVSFHETEGGVMSRAKTDRSHVQAALQPKPPRPSSLASRVQVYEKITTRGSCVKESLDIGHDKSCRRSASFKGVRDDESDTCSELDEEPSADYSEQRRCAVSAEAAGPNNIRFDNWTPPNPPNPPTTAEQARIVSVLENCPIFSGIDTDDMRDLAAAMSIEKFADGDCIFSMGEVGRSGYALLQGACRAEGTRRAKSSAGRNPRCSQIQAFALHEGTFFGEHTMLFGFRRKMTVHADGPVVVAKLKRDVFCNLVTVRASHRRSKHLRFLRNVALFETFDYEMLARMVDAMELRNVDAGEQIVVQGDCTSDEFYIVTKGKFDTIVSVAKVGVRETTVGLGGISNDDDETEKHVMKSYTVGDCFGERAFISPCERGASIIAESKAQVLCFRRKAFERLFSSLEQINEVNYTSDPRKKIADFYSPGTLHGPRGAIAVGADCCASAVDDQQKTDWFAVFRPTSSDALAKMLNGTAVGKGLNVKGKSAKKNRLSGFVPFLQISDNQHKCRVEESPLDARTRIYYHSESDRDSALDILKNTLDDLKHENLSLSDLLITTDDSFLGSGRFGLNVPEIVVREAYIMRPDLTFLLGWETGRHSEPAFMNMNLHALRNGVAPQVVLYQCDDDCMNPHGLLIAYAESNMKPVVSDFDTFTVGSRNMRYEQVPSTQTAVATWALANTSSILETPCASSWNSRWLLVIEEADKAGFHPDIPAYGFGDPTSYDLVDAVVRATSDSGGVRHGAECFNYFFPQELDAEYLIVWEGFDNKPWEYRDEKGVRDFLLARAQESYDFPLNPIWPVRDAGWYEVFDALRKNGSTTAAFSSWYPPEAGIVETIEALHEQFPAGFSSVKATPVESSSHRSSHCSRTFSTGCDGSSEEDDYAEMLLRVHSQI